MITRWRACMRHPSCACAWACTEGWWRIHAEKLPPQTARVPVIPHSGSSLLQCGPWSPFMKHSTTTQSAQPCLYSVVNMTTRAVLAFDVTKLSEWKKYWLEMLTSALFRCSGPIPKSYTTMHQCKNNVTFDGKKRTVLHVDWKCRTSSFPRGSANPKAPFAFLSRIFSPALLLSCPGKSSSDAMFWRATMPSRVLEEQRETQRSSTATSRDKSVNTHNFRLCVNVSAHGTLAVES